MAKEMKKKREKKITPFDVVIVLLVICLFGAFAYRVYDNVAAPRFEKNSQYIVSFSCNDDYNCVAKYLEDGEAVYLSSNGELLGYLYASNAGENPVTVISEATTEAPATETEVEGEDQHTETEEVFYNPMIFIGNLKLNAEAVAVSNGNYYIVGDVNIARGSAVDVYTEDAVFTIVISDIAPIQ